MKHAFWGEIEDDCTVAKFELPGFEPAVQVTFGNARVEPDALTEAALDEYAEVFKSFAAQSESLVSVVHEETFRFYQRVYADYFEHPEVSGEPALGLVTPELHAAKLRGLLGIALSVQRSVELDFDYAVDEEHGLCAMFLDNHFYQVGGIADVAPGRDD